MQLYHCQDQPWVMFQIRDFLDVVEMFQHLDVLVFKIGLGLWFTHLFVVFSVQSDISVGYLLSSCLFTFFVLLSYWVSVRTV